MKYKMCTDINLEPTSTVSEASLSPGLILSLLNGSSCKKALFC